MNRTFAVALLAGLFLAPAVQAQDADAIKGAVGSPGADTIGNVGGDLNIGMIDDDLFITLNMGLNFDFGIVGFGIQAPLRLLVRDVDPEAETYGGAIRKEDWDEWTDYLKILRFFRYGYKGKSLIFAQVGDLPGASLGHGTIINRYYNNTDLDHYKMGIQFDLNTDYGGFETLFNNSVISNLIGVRGYIRPWSFVDTESYMNNLSLGFTFATDYAAPYCIEGQTAAGDRTEACLDQAAGDQPSFDKDGNLRVHEDKTVTIIGGDIEFRLVNTSWLSLTPYMDLNGILDAGIGYHAGILSVFHIPVINLDLSARIEYRYFEGDYIPAYFDSFYEIQKFGYPFKDDKQPKRKVLDDLGEINSGGLNGYYAELIFDFMGLVQIGASYDDYDGEYNSNLRVYLSVPALEVVQFGAYYYRHNYEGAANAFKFDDKSLFLVEARWQFYSPLYLVAQYWRVWQLDKETGIDKETGSVTYPDTYGEYVPVDDWSVGIGVAYSF